jgi:hypothetical protein
VRLPGDKDRGNLFGPVIKRIVPDPKKNRYQFEKKWDPEKLMHIYSHNFTSNSGLNIGCEYSEFDEW